MAIINLNSGYVGSPEKWRIFLKKFATSQEIHDKYHEKLDYQRRNNKPLRTDRSLDNFLKDFDVLGMVSKKEFPSASFRDFKNSGIFDLFKYVDYISYDIDDVIDPIGLLYSKYENKNFFDNLIYDDIPDDLYYSYGTWKESVYDYNGSSNPNYMASNFNMMMGELGFGFQKRKKEAYKNAIVVGVCFDNATGFLLPDELTKDGEMEAWLIDAEDVHRFRSFAEMIIWNLIAAFDHKGSELQDFLKRIGVDEILNLDTLAKNAYLRSDGS